MMKTELFLETIKKKVYAYKNYKDKNLIRPNLESNTVEKIAAVKKNGTNGKNGNGKDQS